MDEVNGRDIYICGCGCEEYNLFSALNHARYFFNLLFLSFLLFFLSLLIYLFIPTHAYIHLISTGHCSCGRGDRSVSIIDLSLIL